MEQFDAYVHANQCYLEVWEGGREGVREGGKGFLNVICIFLTDSPSLPPSLPQVVADIYEPGDLVLVLDYELMLLPMLLRKRFPDVVCGFFLHCPFPSSEFYRMLPVRQPLLQVWKEGGREGGREGGKASV